MVLCETNFLVCSKLLYYKFFSCRWQYFGATTGVHRVFPGHEWPSNFIGFHEDYDPRTRPWYVSAMSGPKDIVLVLDGSESMAKHDRYCKLHFIVISLVCKALVINIYITDDL